MAKEQTMVYVYLAIAIVAEVAATSALKASREFTRLVPSLIVVGGYGVAFYLLTLVIRTMPVGITYAVWAGLGIVLVAVVGAVLYKQIPDVPAVVGMGLIVAGVAMLFIPGQGVLTILIGIMLMNFPGKHALERWLIRRRPIFRSVNWMRAKSGRPPLLLPPERTA